MLTIVTNTNTNTNTNTIVVTTTIASRRKILSELGDQTRMGLFVDLHENREHNQAKHNAHQRNHEGEGLESVDVRGSHVGGGGVTNHAGGDGDSTDDTVGAGACDLIEHRTHGQRHGFVAFACFQLAVFNGVLKAHDHGHLNLGLRQVEQH